MTGSPPPGLTLRPANRPAVCVIPSEHPDGVRPPAAYLVFAEDCRSAPCEGRLWCIGHPVCIGCGAATREGRLVYRRPEIFGQPVDVAAVTSHPGGVRRVG